MGTKEWPTFGGSTSLADLLGNCASVAVATSAVNAAGVAVTENAGAGGDLGDLDIKRMDVKTAISMSLMHEYIQSKGRTLYEAVADGDGIGFVEVGSYAGSIYPIYYSTQTTSYSIDVSDVLVTGGKPLPQVVFGEWINLLEDAEIYTQQTMFNNCRRANFTNHATIVYSDPHMSTEYADGIDNKYNVNSPWEKVIGYAHYKEPPASVLSSPEIKINWGNEASIPIQVGEPGNPVMGNIQQIANVDFDALGGPGCFANTGQAVSSSDGVKIEIPSKWRYSAIRGVPIDKFLRVSAVYLIGLRIDSLFYAPSAVDQMFNAPTTNTSVLWASINKPGINTFKCEEGRHYAIAFQDNVPYIVFAKDTRDGDPFKYGANTTFKLDPFCRYALGSGKETETGTIFPTTKSEGLWVFDIWAVVDVETPSITIFDPNGKAGEIAKAFKYSVSPISVFDLPAPIASATTGLIGQESMQKDGDPTTVQNFKDTDLEAVMDAMQGSGLSVSWSFLDEGGVVDAANAIFGLMSSSQVETVYTLGPQASPRLCGGYGGGIINAIRYSYTDQGSYTISITVGPKLTASSLVQVDGGPTVMMTEDFSARGVVIGSNGDNINFKVRIDGYGDRWAVSMCPAIIRNGDSVQCSIHNNPVES
jgi:hypothetical protein